MTQHKRQGIGIDACCLHKITALHVNTVDDLLLLFRMKFEAIRIRINYKDPDHQTMVETLFAHPKFNAHHLKALYLRDMRSVGFIAQCLYKQKEEKKPIMPLLQELDLSFNYSTPCGESIYKTLLPYLYNDTQLRILRLKGCELNYEVADGIRHALSSLLNLNHRLQVVDVSGIRTSFYLSETNSTILSLGKETHALSTESKTLFPFHRNCVMYNEHVTTKYLLLRICEKKRFDKTILTLLCRFLLPMYSHQAYLLTSSDIVNSKGPLFLSKFTKLQDQLFPTVFRENLSKENDDDDDENSYKAFVKRQSSVRQSKGTGGAEDFIQQRLRYLEMQSDARRRCKKG